MRKIRAVIVDDDLFTREELRDKLDILGLNVEIIADFEHPLEAIESINRTQPDLIFLDIQMPVLNGFEMLDHLNDFSYEVIFITSYNQYAIEAIRYSALDYLLKPLKDEELIKSIERFQNKKERTLTPSKINTLQHNMRANDHDHFQLIIPTRSGEMQFPINQIVRLEADSNYTWIYVLRTPKFLASKTLKELEEQLNHIDFIRAHKSHLVNRKHILQLTENGQLLLRDQSLIEVSRRRLGEVKNLIRI